MRGNCILLTFWRGKSCECPWDVKGRTSLGLPRFFPLPIVMFQFYFVSMPVSKFRPIFVPFQLISLGYAFKFRQQLSHMTELVWIGPPPTRKWPPLPQQNHRPWSTKYIPHIYPKIQLTPSPSLQVGKSFNLITIGNRLTHLKLVDLSLQTVMDVKGALCKITITSENVDKLLSAIHCST